MFVSHRCEFKHISMKRSWEFATVTAWPLLDHVNVSLEKVGFAQVYPS